jgi:phage shock protein PspC (stress-responsive transcriptional regulator)
MEKLNKSSVLRISTLFLAGILGFFAGLASYLGTIQVMAVVLYPASLLFIGAGVSVVTAVFAFLPYEKVGQSRRFGLYCAATATAIVVNFICGRFYGEALMAI